MEVWTGREDQRDTGREGGRERDRERETPFTCTGEPEPWSGQRSRLDPHYAEGAPSPAKMYVSYLQLDKEPTMYPHQNPVTRHPGLSLSPQNFSVPAPPQYTDFAGYHHHSLGNELHPAQQVGPGASSWNPAYPPPPPPPTRDEWSPHHYVAAAAAAAAGGPAAPSTMPGAVGPTLGFSPPEFHGQSPALLNASAGQLSPGSPQRRNAFDWIRRSSAPPCNPSKTLVMVCQSNIFTKGYTLYIYIYIGNFYWRIVKDSEKTEIYKPRHLKCLKYNLKKD